MQAIHLTKTGFRIHFTWPMNRDQLTNIMTYKIRSWYYHYHPKYGSPKVDVRQELVESIWVIDEKTVELKLPLNAGRVYHIECGATAQDGASLANKIGYYTLNRLKS